MAKRQCSVLRESKMVTTCMSSGMPVATTSIAPSTESLPFKTCSKCRSLFKTDGNMSIHSTLAYSRCRCHRYFKFSLQQKQFGLSHGMWLDGTISTAEDSRMHQNEKSPDCKEHSECITVVHSSSDQETPHHTALPLVTPLQKSVTGFSSSVLCEPIKKSAKKTLLHGNSPEMSTLKLPALGCPSLVSHHVGQTSQLDVTHDIPMKKSSVFQPTALYSLSPRRKIRELGDIIWCIPQSTQQELKTKFKSLDKDGDGHLTFSEFLQGLPQCSEDTMSSSIQRTLKEMYLEVSDTTYFGVREFIVCSSIAEVLLKYNLQTTVVDRNFLRKILTPYSECLSEFARDGMISARDIKDAAAMFTDNQSHYKVSSLSTKVLKVCGKDSAPLLHCIAMAPYYLNVLRK